MLNNMTNNFCSPKEAGSYWCRWNINHVIQYLSLSHEKTTILMLFGFWLPGLSRVLCWYKAMIHMHLTRLCFYQTRSAWSMDQGSNRKHSAVHNFAPTVTKFCVMWEGQALPHDTKFSNCRCEILGRRVIFISSLIPGSSWSGMIKAEPGGKMGK